MKTLSSSLLLMLLIGSGCTTTQLENENLDVMDNDPMIVQVSSMARTAFDSGEIPRALVLYRRALERARAMDNSVEIGASAYNLAVCHVALEDLEEAGVLLAESERETLRAGGDAGPAVLLLAEIQRKNGEWKKALETINRLEKLDVDNQARGLAYVMRAHIACDRNLATEAEAFLSRARGYLRKNKDSGLAGEISNASGRIAMLNENWADAAIAFDREAAWMKRSSRLYEMALALDRAGTNYQKAGDAEAASDRFFRAARSLMAQDFYLDALRVIEQAVALQNGSTDAETAAAVASLFEDIQGSVEQMSRAATE